MILGFRHIESATTRSRPAFIIACNSATLVGSLPDRSFVSPILLVLIMVSNGTNEKQKRPAVLALHPTSPLGKGVVAGEGPKENRNYARIVPDRYASM
jgi:hypothetical protein